MSIRLLLYDDKAVMRMSMEAYCADHAEINLLAAMPNAHTVEEDIIFFDPEVVFMDIDMPGVNGVEALKRIRKLKPALPVIMLTVFEEDEHIFESICAGASGYLLKGNNATTYLTAIKEVMSGGAPMTGTIARKVLKMLPRNQEAKSGDITLSPKETEILEWLVKGYSYKMISAETGISIDTVRFHIKKIYDKLQVHSATEAVSTAIKKNLIRL